MQRLSMSYRLQQKPFMALALEATYHRLHPNRQPLPKVGFSGARHSYASACSAFIRSLLVSASLGIVILNDGS